MKGRSSEQVAAYERKLGSLVEVLKVAPMSVREIMGALAKKRRRIAAATVYARLEVLAERGAVTSAKRRRKIPGKSGQRERVYAANGH